MLKIHRPDALGRPLCGARSTRFAQPDEEPTCQSCNYIYKVEERKRAPLREVKVLKEKIADLEQVIDLQNQALKTLEEENADLRTKG